MLKIISKNHYRTASLLVVMLLVFTPMLAAAQAETSWAQSIVYYFVANVSGMFVWMGGQLLDIAITTFVVGFGDLYQTSGLGFSINNLWTVIRDIFNLTFVFGIVFIGFKMILNADDSSARKNLISLIMAALLVNFSLYITKMVVDFSNLAAMQLATGFYDSATSKYDVSQSFMNLLGISGLWGAGGSMPTGQNGWAFIIGTLIINLVGAFVFFAGGLLLMIRFAVLNIYMVLSPIMFLGMVFPGFMSTSRDFWNGFMKRAFFAPAYILMLYLANQVLVNMKGASGAGSLNKALTANTASDAATNFAASMPYFILTSVFLVAAIVVGQKMGAQGATTAAAIGRRWTDKTRQYATGRAMAAPRAVVNYAGEKGVKKLNTLQSKNYGNGIIAGTAGAILRTNTADRLTRGGLTAMGGAKLGTGTTNQAERDYKSKTMIRAAQTGAEETRSKAFKDNIATLADTTKTVEDLNKAFNDLATNIKAMSKDEKNGLDIETLTNKSVSANLSDDDLKNLEASGNFSAPDIQKIKDARKQAFVSIAKYGNTLERTTGADSKETFTNPQSALVNKRQSITSRGVADVGTMPNEIFTTMEMYDHLTPQMLNEKIKKGGFGNDQSQVVKAINDYLLTQTNNPNVINAWGRWAREDSNGIKMGITIPQAAAPAAAAANAGPRIEVPLNVGGGPRPRN